MRRRRAPICRRSAARSAQLSLEQDLTSYFDRHHTAADTFDKLDAMDLAIDTAAVAVAAYGLADATETLPIVALMRRGLPQPGAAPAASPPGASPTGSPGASAK